MNLHEQNMQDRLYSSWSIDLSLGRHDFPLFIYITNSASIIQDSLKLVILLAQMPECWDHRHNHHIDPMSLLSMTVCPTIKKSFDWCYFSTNLFTMFLNMVILMLSLKNSNI